MLKHGYILNNLNTLKVVNCSVWIRMEKISWTDRERNEILRRVTEERNILCTIKRRNVNWIGHILCMKCLLNSVTEGKIEGWIYLKGGRGRRGKQLCNSLMERKGYWKLK